MKNLTVRVNEETVKDIERLAELEKTDKSTVTRRLLATGLQQAKKGHALSLYRAGKCTLWKASQKAGVPLREMMETIKKKRFPMHISPEDVEAAWRIAFEEE